MATETTTTGSVTTKEGEEAVEVVRGAETLSRAIELLTEHGLPDGLLPMQEVVEMGYNKATGYVWVTQKKPIVHTFQQIAKQVSYSDKITAFLEKGRLRKLTGVKAKEFLWVSIVDIAVHDSDSDRLFFKSFTGLGKLFPVTAFLRQDA